MSKCSWARNTKYREREKERENDTLNQVNRIGISNQTEINSGICTTYNTTWNCEATYDDAEIKT